MTLVTDHLERRGIRFEMLPHPPVETARDEARVLGLSPLEVLKVLLLDVEDGHALAIIPSYRRLDLTKVRRILGDRHAHLATEAEIEQDLPDFELGALPAVPALMQVPVVVDPEVFQHTKVTFAAGVKDGSVRADPYDVLTGAPITVARIVGPIDVPDEEAAIVGSSGHRS